MAGVFWRAHVDRNETVAYAYRIQSIPRTVVLNIHGEVVGDRIGFLDADDYLGFLDQVKEFTHTKVDGTVIEVPASRAASVEITRATAPDELVELLGDRDPEVRARAREQLLSRNSDEIKRLLEQALAHEYLGVRISAYEILRQTFGGQNPDYDPWAGQVALSTVVEGPPSDEP